MKTLTKPTTSRTFVIMAVFFPPGYDCTRGTCYPGWEITRHKVTAAQPHMPSYSSAASFDPPLTCQHKVITVARMVIQGLGNDELGGKLHTSNFLTRRVEAKSSQRYKNNHSHVSQKAYFGQKALILIVLAHQLRHLVTRAWCKNIQSISRRHMDLQYTE